MIQARATQATALDEREQRIWADHEWVLNDTQLQLQYAGNVVAVHDRKVWGIGKTHQAALEAALSQPACPARGDIVTVAVEGRAAPINGLP
jgi:hypothetical protein